MITMKTRKVTPDSTVIYMEVYGTNHVVYRVTASTILRKGREIPVYGLMLEDSRTGYTECIENFSENMEHTLAFAGSLVRRKIRPGRLCCEALRELRLSPQCMPPM